MTDLFLHINDFRQTEIPWRHMWQDLSKLFSLPILPMQAPPWEEKGNLNSKHASTQLGTFQITVKMLEEEKQKYTAIVATEGKGLDF